MREFKFRAWNKDDKQMEIVFKLDYINGEITTGDKIDETETEYFDYGFNDVVLMQFTGLKDKNGKEIYEGDIVNAIEFHLHEHSGNSTSWCNKEIIYHEGSFCFIIKGSEGFPDMYVNICNFWGERRMSLTNDKKYKNIIEVVGNKFENSELLKVKE